MHERALSTQSSALEKAVMDTITLANIDKRDLDQKVRRLQGPILALGASGFVGANLFRMLLKSRSDVFGTTSRFPAWRLEGLPQANVLMVDLLVDSNLDKLLDDVKPR